MKQNNFLIITLITGYALSSMSTPNNLTTDIIQTAFEQNSLPDVYATLHSTHHALLNELKKRNTHASAMQPSIETSLIKQQIDHITPALTALEPLITDAGAVDIKLHTALMTALEQERMMAQKNTHSRIDPATWSTLSEGIKLLSQTLTSSASDSTPSSTQRLLGQILAPTVLAGALGYGGYKIMSKRFANLNKVPTKPVKIQAAEGIKGDIAPTPRATIVAGEHKLSGIKAFALDLLVQFIIMKGQAFAESLMAGEDQVEQQKIVDNITALQKNLSEAQKKLSDETSTRIQQMYTDFSTNLATISTTTTQALDRAQQEFSYILQLINLAQAKDMFPLKEPIFFDHLFAQSTMLTPDNDQHTQWHNMWNDPDNYGTWLFDPALNAFVQAGAPLGSLKKNITSYLQDQSLGTDKNFNPLYADYNQIFTEYFTDEDGYEITVDITLIDAAFPFCCGIAFNKARWLAGAMDRNATYRFVGLIGTVDAEKTKTVSLYACQSKMIATTMFSPLSLILNPPTIETTIQPIITLKNDVTKKIGTDPLTYTVHIKNHRDYIELSVIPKNETKPLNPNKIVTMSNDQTMNNLLWWYHGIGFIAPRCQATFALKAPSELIYTDTDLEKFKTTIATIPHCLTDKDPNNFDEMAVRSCMMKGQQ